MANVIKFKRGTTANVAKLNGVDLPLLQEGEIAIDITTNTIKVGDGLTAWNNLRGINADTLDSFHASQGTDANNVAVRNADGKLPGDILGNSETSTKLKTPRTIALSGDATGSATFDGSDDATIAATVNNAAQAAKLAIARTIALSGDASGSTTFDGSANATISVTVNNSAKLGGYSPSTKATANTVPVRDDDGALPGNITGNAATATKLTTARTIALSGDASGSTTFDGSANATISATVNDSAKVGGYSPSATVVASTVPVRDANGDLPGNITGNAATATKLATARTIALSGDASGSASFDGTANATIVTTVNDSAKVGGYSPSSTATANTVPVRDDDGKLAGDITGNAATATKLATARTIELIGDVTGSTTFDGSTNKTITTVVADDSHNHTISTITDIANASVAHAANAAKLNNYSPSTEATANTIPVRDDDGKLAGDILGNADTVDGFHASQSVIANNIAVRDADGKLPGDITGNAATATNASKLAGLLPSTTNEPNTVVVRDEEGNIVGGTIVGQIDSADKVDGFHASQSIEANTVAVRDADGKLPGDITGNAATATSATSATSATKLAKARTIALSGDVTGSTTFDGSANVTIAATVNNSAKLGGYSASTEATANTVPVRDANGALPGDITGNAATATTATTAASATTATTATKLATARTIALSGDATGSTTFDGSANKTIAVTVNNSAKLGGYSASTKATANTIPVRDDDGKLPGDITGNAATATTATTAASATTATSATKLATARTIALSGDVTGSTTFDGSANKTIAVTVNNSAKLGGYSASTKATANTIPVRDANGKLAGDITGNAATATTASSATTATKLATARTISLTGDVTGSTTFDGSANKTIATTVNNSAKVGGYSPSTSATANAVAVRDANGKLPGDITGNAATATTATKANKLTTSRIISLTGDVSGSTPFDGSRNATIAVAVHNAARLAGYSPNTGTGANTIPVRNSSGALPGNITGNAATATKLAKARTIKLTGAVTGSASFDGSRNVSIATTANVPNFIAATWTTTKPTNVPTHGKTYVTQQIITIPAGTADIMYYFPYKFNPTDGVMFDIWISCTRDAGQNYEIFYGNDSEKYFWFSKSFVGAPFPYNFTDYINCNILNEFSGQVQVIGQKYRQEFHQILLTPGPYYLKLRIFQESYEPSFTINLSTRLYYY